MLRLASLLEGQQISQRCDDIVRWAAMLSGGRDIVRKAVMSVTSHIATISQQSDAFATML